MLDAVALAAPAAPLRFAPTLETLSEEQRAIVERLDGALLALAPAGTGKTTVLTERVASALDAGIPPERILCVTFTNRAARELRARIQARFPGLGGLGMRLAPRTFHQLCADILRREAKRVGLMVDFSVCPDHDSVAMLKRILQCPEDDDREAVQVYQRLQETKLRWPTNQLLWPLGATWARAGFEDARLREAAQKYERGLSQWQLVDFADLVLYVRALFKAVPEVMEHWASRYDLVQVDEIQDTHLAEYEVVATLARQSGNLALFGDLDQTIYEWRGAVPQRVMDRFGSEFGAFFKAHLTDNHRATRTLIRAADRFAASFDRRETRLAPAATCAEGEPIQEHVADTVSGEADWIAQRVKALAEQDGVPLPAIGILAPANWYCEEIARALARHHVPHLTAARVAFFRRPEIADALAYLQPDPEPGRHARRAAGLGALDARPGPPGAQSDPARGAARTACGWSTSSRWGRSRRATRTGRCWRRSTTARSSSSTWRRPGWTRRATRSSRSGRCGWRAGGARRSTRRWCSPSVPVGESERFHGLSDERLQREGLPPEEAIGRLLTAAEGALLVGHNIGRFDLRMLAAQAERLGLSFAPGPSADTLDLARRFVEREPYTLEALAETLRLPHRPTHRAGADVATTADLLAWLVERARRGVRQRRALVAECGSEFEALARQLAGWRATGRHDPAAGAAPPGAPGVRPARAGGHPSRPAAPPSTSWSASSRPRTIRPRRPPPRSARRSTGRPWRRRSTCWRTPSSGCRS